MHARVLCPGLQALDLRLVSHTPPALRTVFAALDTATETLITETGVPGSQTDSCRLSS